MAFTRRNEVQTHLRATADTRGLTEMVTQQRRALSQMRSQQAMFARSSLGQFQRIDKATRNVMRRTGTGATASLAKGLNSGGRQLHQAGNNLVSIAQKHAVRMGGVFQQLGFQASLVGTSMTHAFTAPVAAAVALSTVVGVKLAARLESAKTSLGALLPKGYAVEKLLNRLREAAIKSPVFNTVQLVDFTRKLVASGVEVSKTERMIGSLGKVFQTFGVTGEGANLALRGITQAFSKGKLQAEELTGQIGEQIPALALLSRAAGKSQGEFLKMVSAGEITSEVLGDLLIKVGSFPEINRGATASLNTMQGAWDRLKESVFDALAMTWLKYTPQIQESLKQIEEQIPNTFKAFGPLIPRLVEGFASLVKAAINLLAWYNNLDDGTRKLVNAFGLMLVTAGPLIVFFGKLATGVGAAFVVFRTILTPVGALTVALSALAGVGVVAWLNSLGKEGGLLGGIMDRLSAGWDSAGKAASKLGDGVTRAAGHLRNAKTDFSKLEKQSTTSLRNMGTDFGAFEKEAVGSLRNVKSDFDTLSGGSLRTAETDFGKFEDRAVGSLRNVETETDKLAVAVNGNLRSAKTDFDDTASKSVGLAGTFRSLGRDYTTLATTTDGKAFRDLTRDFGNLGDVAETGARDPIKKLGADLRMLKDSITDNLLPAIGDFGKKLGDELQPALENINDIIGGKGGGLIGTLKTFTDDLAAWVETNGDKIAEGIGRWAEDLTGGVKDALDKGDWKAVGKSLGSALGKALGGVGDLTGDLKKLFEKVDWVDVGKEVGKNAFGFVIGFISSLGEDIATGDFWKKHWEDALIAAVSIIGIGKVASALGKVIAKVGPKAFKGAGKFFGKAWEGVTKVLGKIKWPKFKAPDFLKKIKWPKINLPKISFGGLLKKMKDEIKNIASDIKKNLEDVFDLGGIKKRITDGFNTIKNRFQRGLDDIGLRLLYAKDAISKKIHSLLLDPLYGAGRGLKSAFITFIGRFVFITWLVEAGKDVVRGFVNGVVETAKGIWKTFKDEVIDPIIDGVKDFLGIKSPSTFFAEIGKNIVEGLKDGIASAVSGLGSLFTNAWESIKTTATEKWNSIKDTVTGTWDSLKNSATEKWNSVKNTLGSAWDSIKNTASEKWGQVKDAVSGALNKIKERTGIDTSSVKSTITTSWDAVKNTTSKLWGMTRDAVANALDRVKEKTSSATIWIKDTLKNAWNNVMAGVRVAWDTVVNVIRSRWNAARNTISQVWNKYIWPLFKTIIRVITRNVPDAFRNGVDAVGRFFSRIAGIVRTPIKWVVEVLINKHIIGSLNSLRKNLGVGGKGIPSLPPVGGTPRAAPAQRSGLTAGRAKGGRLRGGIPGKDSIPVMAMHDEYVVKTKSARKLGFDKLEYINKYGELPGYAKGGRVHGKRMKTSDKVSPSKRAGGPFDIDIGLLMNPAKWLSDKVGITRVLDQFKNLKGTAMGNIVTGMSKSAFDMALAKLTSWIGSFGDDGGGTYLGRDPTSSIQTILTVARRFYRGARVSSGYRPGERTYHGRGLAADLIGGGARGMATMARGFMGMSGRLLELIHSGGGGFFVKHGKRVGAGYYRSEIPAHFNHVHVAARKDALLANLGGALGTGGGNLGAWVRQAMGITNTSNSWYAALVALAKHESGGNPRAQNNWDSNAARGTPSKGLFQTIEPTFNRWSLPGMKNIWNPVHNAVAAIRYIKNRYGSIFRIPSYRSGNRFVGGYEFGTPFVPQTGMALVHKGERIIPAAQNRGYEIRSHRKGGDGDIHVHFEGSVMGHRDLETAITGIVDKLRSKGRLPTTVKSRR